MITPEETSGATEIKKKKKEEPGKKELAIERTMLAQERTLSSWVRTNASFITFGFAIYKLLESRAEEVGHTRLLLGFLGPREIGLIMIMTGFVGLVLAVVRHFISKNVIKRFGRSYFSVSLVQAYIMLALSALLIYGALTANPGP
jgi:putative membrane protein